MQALFTGSPHVSDEKMGGMCTPPVKFIQYVHVYVLTNDTEMKHRQRLY